MRAIHYAIIISTIAFNLSATQLNNPGFIQVVLAVAAAQQVEEMKQKHPIASSKIHNPKTTSIAPKHQKNVRIKKNNVHQPRQGY